MILKFKAGAKFHSNYDGKLRVYASKETNLFLVHSATEPTNGIDKIASEPKKNQSERTHTSRKDKKLPGFFYREQSRYVKGEVLCS